MKRCSQCKIEKDETEFNAYPRAADGLAYQCKSCISENGKKTRAKNKLDAKQNQLKYKDVDKICSSCKITKTSSEFYKNSTTFDGYSTQCKVCNDISSKRTRKERYADVVVDWQALRMCTRCDEIKPTSEFRQNKWQKDGVNTWCKSCVIKYEMTIESQIRMMLTRAKQRAKRKDLSFDIDYDYVVDLLSPSIEHPICPVLGFEMKWKTINNPDNKFKNKSPSLDRIDNTKGYTKDNVAVISFKANNMKRAYTRDEFMMLVDWLDSLTI